MCSTWNQISIYKILGRVRLFSGGIIVRRRGIIELEAERVFIISEALYGCPVYFNGRSWKWMFHIFKFDSMKNWEVQRTSIYYQSSRQIFKIIVFEVYNKLSQLCAFSLWILCKEIQKGNSENYSEIGKKSCYSGIEFYEVLTGFCHMCDYKYRHYGILNRNRTDYHVV
jgi:hypothetical protein